MAVQYNITSKSNNPLVPKLTNTVPDILARQLGAGFALPMKLINNSWQTKQGLQYVQQCVVNTVMTPVGRNMVWPSFGSMVPYLMFQAYTKLLGQEIITNITQALNTWVTSINNISVTIDDSQANQNILNISISYQLKGTNSNDSLQIVLTTNPNLNLPPGDFALNNQYIFQV